VRLRTESWTLSPSSKKIRAKSTGKNNLFRESTRFHIMLSLLTLHFFLLWSLQNCPPSYSYGLVKMAPNIQPFEHLPVPVEDERIRCALLGCGMVSLVFLERTVNAKRQIRPEIPHSMPETFLAKRWDKSTSPILWDTHEISE
jgi:hypothetical protein